MRHIFLATLALTMARPAIAADVMASNGIVVKVTGDEFDGRLEYTAPHLRIGEYGFLIVAVIKPTGQQAGPVKVVGSVVYDGDWRRYFAANFRGGESAKAIFNDRSVVSCSGSRYSRGCTLREGFDITLTDAQIAQYAVNGLIDLKLKAQASNEEPVVQVPVSYMAAVKEISGR